ncbi:MAG TPA: FGGY-family carbohydrate kinase [Bacillota bacterium]|nr:FGGY-family carbohydrate kinase [Bacillota bacterium]
MPKNLNLLAIDLGAESGRVILGRLSGSNLSLEEIHRFLNEPVQMGGHLYWDFPGLLREIKKGIRLARQKAGEVDGMAVDTWGVDFGFLDSTGELLANPIHYRDRRTDGIFPRFFATVPREEVYRQTGIQMMTLNSSCQMMALREENPQLLESACDLLFTPGLLTYFLCGKKANDSTIASTSQLYNPVTHDWAYDLLKKLSLPAKLFTAPVQPGTILGNLTPDVAMELGFDNDTRNNVKIIAGAGHDTAAAVAAIPALEAPFAYISCGTWSLIGTELDSPLINPQAEALNFTNEVGVNRRIRFLKNVIGLWLLQQCRQSWAKQGQTYDYDQLTQMATMAQPWQAMIDPDDPAFLNPRDMLEAIIGYLQKTGQPIPAGPGEMVCCITESLALKYWWVIERLEELTGRRFANIHMVGGGIKNELLCQLTADISGKPVVAGPVEATAIGNLLIQALALGEIPNLEELRRIVHSAFPPRIYTPRPEQNFDTVKQRFVELVK